MRGAFGCPDPPLAAPARKPLRGTPAVTAGAHPAAGSRRLSEEITSPASCVEEMPFAPSPSSTSGSFCLPPRSSFPRACEGRGACPKEPDAATNSVPRCVHLSALK